ncbi:MAG: glycoside hydrolase family 3 C-terminal domain-containing protein, partial [Cytophagaceae bacterium]
TDWLDIIALENMHFIAENEKEATYLAINAGVDMSMTPLTTDFCRYLYELVQEKRISEERINQSVRRILKLKLDLGLFENPYPRNDRFDRIGHPEHKKIALDAARESIVLVKNTDKILPLENIKKIVVTGSTADKRVALSGGWTYRFAPKTDYWFPKDMPTVYTALKKQLQNTSVILSEASKLKSTAADAQAIIVVVGEEEGYAETDGTIDDLDLSDKQLREVQAAIATGKPVILVLTEGRPRLINKVADRCQAIVFAGLPGNEGATAIAEILSGKVNPSGKMSFTYPWKSGHIIPYNYKRSEFSSFRPVPDSLLRFALIEFGQGLSYTDFIYSDLALSDTAISKNQSLTCTIKVTNNGSRIGKESVLWFVTDEFASITRPNKQLKYFEKQEIAPGESKTYTFIINPEKDLWFPDHEGKKLLEEGYFTIKVGDQTARFKLI